MKKTMNRAMKSMMNGSVKRDEKNNEKQRNLVCFALHGGAQDTLVLVVI